MPKQNLMIAAGAVIIAVLAIGGYFLFGRGEKAPEAPIAATEEATTEAQTKGSIRSLLAGGQNQTCSINMMEQGGEGIIYVSGEKVRGDFTTIIEGKPVASHMILDGGFLYTWSDGVAQGVKINIAEVALPSPSPGTAFDLDQEVDLQCSPWSPDDSKFTPPTNVTFQDLTQTLKQVAPQSGGGQPQQGSSPCDAITDPQAKAACLQYAQ